MSEESSVAFDPSLIVERSLSVQMEVRSVRLSPLVKRITPERVVWAVLLLGVTLFAVLSRSPATAEPQTADPNSADHKTGGLKTKVPAEPDPIELSPEQVDKVLADLLYPNHGWSHLQASEPIDWKAHLSLDRGWGTLEEERLKNAKNMVRMALGEGDPTYVALMGLTGIVPLENELLLDTKPKVAQPTPKAEPATPKDGTAKAAQKEGAKESYRITMVRSAAIPGEKPIIAISRRVVRTSTILTAFELYKATFMVRKYQTWEAYNAVAKTEEDRARLDLDFANGDGWTFQDKLTKKLLGATTGEQRVKGANLYLHEALTYDKRKYDHRTPVIIPAPARPAENPKK